MTSPLFPLPPSGDEKPLPRLPHLPTEYLLVTDRDSKILRSTNEFKELKDLAKTIRDAGGEVTIFRAVKG